MNEMDWRKKLTPEQYRIMREKGTEPAFTGKYWNSHEQGMYACAACGAELFSSDAKFDSGTGWPSFTQPHGAGAGRADPVHPVRTGAANSTDDDAPLQSTVNQVSDSDGDLSNGASRQNIELKEDTSHGMSRVEVLCKNCGSHLGHVFDDGPAASGKRYCINSACLDLKKHK